MMSKDHDSTAKKFAIGAAIAAAAGYVVGLLTAPKAGKAVRQDVKDNAAKGAAEAEKQLKNVQDELKNLLDDASATRTKLSAKAKQELQDLTETAADAKDKTGAVLKAIKNGAADDKELQKAVADAKTAIKHLRKYLSK